jgi:tetratricopeptide (TPR) repeat protein
MKTKRRYSNTVTVLALLLFLVTSAALVVQIAGALTKGSADPAEPPGGRIAPLLKGIGVLNYPVSTASGEAQRYFNQGLMLAYGFNHAEAARSFAQAARLDDQCAMCYWGEALVLGPNINAPMAPDAAGRAHALARKAVSLSAGATEKEQALIAALAHRYRPGQTADRDALDQAYADAMREVAAQYPNDADTAALFAESLMDLHPWDYWTKEGNPQPWTSEIIAVLEKALALDPKHPGALHFYIHAVEASSEPWRGEPHADRLSDLLPGTSHLAHMPAHIYIRVGRYDDAVKANIKAMQEDEQYIAQCHAQGLYPLAYMPHNAHFLWYAATMEGRSALSGRTARHTAESVDPQMLNHPAMGGLMQHFSLLPLYDSTRFGKWDAVLQAPMPDAGLPYPVGIWHYSRGMALTAAGRIGEAASELARLRELAADPAMADLQVWDANSAASLLQIAANVLAAEIAAAQMDFDRSIRLLGNAVRQEEGLTYIEPPDWYFPVRQMLGAVLLKAGRPAEAEAVYREDLRINPNNGWSLFGLAQSLRFQNRHSEAEETEARFRQAWARADVKLTASRF